MDPRVWYGEQCCLPPFSSFSGVAGCGCFEHMCLCVYTHTEGGLAPAPFLPHVMNKTVACHNRWRHKLSPSLQGHGIMLAGKESWRSHSPGVHRSRAAFTVSAGDVCEPDEDILQVPIVSWRISARACHGVFGTALAKAITCSPHKGYSYDNWKQSYVFKAVSHCSCGFS